MVILSRRLIIKTLFADEVCKENINLNVLGLALVLGRVSIVDFPSEACGLVPILHMAGAWTPSRPGPEQDRLTTRVWRASNAAPVEPNAGRQGLGDCPSVLGHTKMAVTW